MSDAAEEVQVKEGQATLYFASKKGVFYNPPQIPNRDLSVMALQQRSSRRTLMALPLPIGENTPGPTHLMSWVGMLAMTALVSCSHAISLPWCAQICVGQPIRSSRTAN